VPRSLVVKVTCGDEAPERCVQAFTVAATAVASGIPVSLWLTGEASWLATPGRAEAFELAESARLADLLATILEGGRVTLCTQCAARRGLTAADLRPGISIAGAATFVGEVTDDHVQALVY
jgi:predicted peroxiredoxin